MNIFTQSAGDCQIMTKNFFNFFEKPIDFLLAICYNKDTEKVERSCYSMANNGKISDTQANNLLREEIIAKLKDFFTEQGEDFLRIAQGEFCFPTVDKNGEDKFIQIVVKIPKGSRDGEPFDGYGLAEDFQMKSEEKAEKAKKMAEKKKAKIAKDEELRRKKKENLKKAKNREQVE